MNSKDLLIFIPTYNECENIGRLVGEIQSLNLKANLLLLDDSSPDGTGKAIDSLAKKFSNIHVVHRPRKMGIGGAHKSGIRWAYAHGFQTLLTLDADFSHSPSDIPRLLKALESADVVVGSRHLQKGSLAGWRPTRIVLTKLGHFLTRHLLDLDHDASGAFRVYRLTAISKELFEKVESDDYAFFFESLFLLSRADAKIVDVPISLPPRTRGHSKMTYRDVVRSAEQLFRLYLFSTEMH